MHFHCEFFHGHIPDTYNLINFKLNSVEIIFFFDFPGMNGNGITFCFIGLSYTVTIM